LIDRERGEGRADCLRIHPSDVFELAVLAKEQRGVRALRGQMKATVRGRRQVIARNACERQLVGFSWRPALKRRSDDLARP